MQTDLQIGLITSYGGKPLDIILPIIGENEFRQKTETSGHCFHIFSLAYTKILLFSKNRDGEKRTALIDIRTSCKVNCDISIFIVKMNNGELYLRAYSDANVNGLYRLPYQLTAPKSNH